MASPLNDMARSRGLKLFIICALVLLMAIPALFVSAISFERADRAKEVFHEVSQMYGGEQYVTGPFLTVPYTVTSPKGELMESGEYVIFPDEGEAVFDNVDIEIRKRSLFKVPVFNVDGKLAARFLPVNKEAISEHRTMNWDAARILIGISDGRGLRGDIYLTDKSGVAQPARFEPAASYLAQRTMNAEVLTSENYKEYRSYALRSDDTLLSVPAKDFIERSDGFAVTVDIPIAGSGILGAYPFARTTKVRMTSDWPSPGFQGGFPPTDREISQDGFTADWRVNNLARGVIDQGPVQAIRGFTPDQDAMSVQFVAQVNPYQTVNRALKYSVLFIGLVFMVFFLFETVLNKRVHPAQYILIGIAQTVFYLLLLAFSEHMGFDLSYLIAAGATIALTSLYAGTVFGGRKYAGEAALLFTLTYGLLYMLMRRSDYALLLGALTCFFVIAITMYITRNINWYGDSQSRN